jgi:uncharacterized protein (TIGR03435 family)
MTVTNNSLYNLIRNAYGSQRYEMVPGPKLQTWVDSERWDILAKPPAGAPEVQEQMQLRLRSLLEDRFKLVARREMREMPIYELVVARSDGQLGPQIKRSGDECGAQGRARDAGVHTASSSAWLVLWHPEQQRKRIDEGRSAVQLRSQSRRDDGPRRNRPDGS